MTDHGQVADVLDAAADYIEKHGLEREHISGMGPGGRRCSVVTLCDLTDHGRGFLYSPAEAALLSHLGLWRTIDLQEWSDSSPNDQEVLDAFRLAAKQERILADAAS